MDISQYCISDDATIFSTMEMIQKNRNRCICVVNENKKFLGVVSQGDILSALIAGVNLYSQVRKIVNGNISHNGTWNRRIVLFGKNILQLFR